MHIALAPAPLVAGEYLIIIFMLVCLCFSYTGQIFVVARYSPTIPDKSPEEMAIHVKPPLALIHNKTSKWQ